MTNYDKSVDLSTYKINITQDQSNFQLCLHEN